MGNIKMPQTNQRKLSLNTVSFPFKSDVFKATKYLDLHQIPFQIMESGEGYWLNVSWKCGITAPLTYQELRQLPDYKSIKSKETSMSKTKTETTKAVAKITVDPRVRMKEIRSDVAFAIKNGIRVDQMTYPDEDNYRVIIALQDQLDRANKAHAKATKHIASMVDYNNIKSMMYVTTINDANMRVQRMQEELSATSAQNNLLHEQCVDANSDAYELQQILTDTEERLEAALLTVRTLLEERS